MDSGCSGNFFSQALLKQLDLAHQRQAKLKIETIEGKPLGCGHIKFQSLPITLQVDCLHQERISFLVLEGPTVDIILGHLWLYQYPPKSDGIPARSSNRVKPASKTLSNIPVPLVSNPKLQVYSTLVESPKPCEVPTIPSDYTAFQDVFSKQVAKKLPPHRPWDCAIDLLPGALLPKG